jgi:exodeoxyribonuclease V alpha subunit
MPDIFPGETVEVTGSWTTNPKYGEQFAVSGFTRREPTGTEAIAKFLSSGVLRGVGPGIAKAIVTKFGERSFDVIEQTPEKLAEISGITDARAREISAEMKRTAGLRRLSQFLSDYGIEPIVASRLYKVLGSSAESDVRANPYIIVSPDYGGKFREADLMAKALGFPRDAIERIEAAVVHELRYNLTNGHVFIPSETLVRATLKFLEGDDSPDYDTVADAFVELSEMGLVERDTVNGVDVCYLPEYHEAETYSVAKLTALLDEETTLADDEIDAMLTKIEQSENVKYADGQKLAVFTAAKHRVMALTGGPGTGKTTSVRAILALYDAMGLDTLLCAPTGRAAKRMSELTGRQGAMTVHRALGASPAANDELVFERCEENPLKCGAVVLDEASMLDLPLLHALLSALPDDARLLLVGDENQLPSVGPGNVLADITKSGIVPVVTLTEIFRQAAGSAIVRAAHSVNRGEEPNLAERGSDLFFLKRTGAEQIAQTVTELITARLPNNMGIPSGEIQVLTPTRQGVAGTRALNTRLQAALNPPDAKKLELVRSQYTLRAGDRVMQIRNNYDLTWTDANGDDGAGVYNGDLGVIRAIDFASDTLTVDFEDKLAQYPFGQLDDLEPAYAMTVHKSQGSEYRAVVLVLPPGLGRLAVRSVLYTAITRARELLVIVGDPATLTAMVANNERLRRYSGLRYRLRDS